MAKIILLTHQKGGVGKSTLAFNLAQNICSNTKVCVVDIDRQGSNAMIKDMVKDFDIIEHSEDFKNISNLDYDFIIVDTPPYIIENSHTLYDMSDLILIPTKAGIYDLLAIKKSILDINESGNKEKILVVFNMIKPNTNITEQAINNVKEHNVKIAKSNISDYVSFASSIMTNGVQSNHKAQRQIDQLTKEILVNL